MLEIKLTWKDLRQEVALTIEPLVKGYFSPVVLVLCCICPGLHLAGTVITF